MSLFSSSVGPVDLLMSSPSTSFLPFSPSDMSPPSPPSPPSPLAAASSSLPLPLPLPASSSLSAFDAPIDSPTSLSLFILRCREEIGHHARVLLATKLTNVQDAAIRQTFLDTGGLDVLLSWLDPATNSPPVLSHTLDALSILPLTSSHLESHPSLLSTLTSLRSHPDESISQSADDLLATIDRQRQEGNDKEEKDVEAEDEGSKFRSIKIDKTTADTHTAASEAAESGAEAVKVVAFEQQTEEEQDVSSDTGRARVKAEKELQVAMAGKMEAESVAAVGSVSRKRKRTGLTVRWAEDDKLQSYKYFLKEEPIVKREKKRHTSTAAPEDGEGNRSGAGRLGQSMQDSKPLTASLDWYCPARFTLPPLLQAQQQDRGRLSSEKQTQREREKTTLRAVYMPGQETIQQPVDSSEKLELSDVGVPVIPFELPRQQAPATPSPAETKTSGADLSNQTAELLSKLTSLASLINAPSSSSSAAVAPSGASPYQPPLQHPAPSGNGLPASALSSLFSSLASLPSSVPSTLPAPATASLPPPPPAAAAVPSGGTLKLLSLLSNSNALSGLAAALQQAPTPPTALPPQPPAQPLYAAPSHAAAYPPPPPPATSYAPPAAAHPAAASSGYYASAQSGYPSLTQPQPSYAPPAAYPPPSPAYSHPPAAAYTQPSPPSYAPQLSVAPYSAPASHAAPAAYSAYTGYPSTVPTPLSERERWERERFEQERERERERQQQQQQLLQQQQQQQQQQAAGVKRRRFDERPPEAGPSYKKKRCTFWSSSGTCRQGDRCTFFHEGPDGHFNGPQQQQQQQPAPSIWSLPLHPPPAAAAPRY